MLQLLMVRCSNKPEGWLFPSRRAECGHLTTVAKQFREARTKADLPETLVLYGARHTFGMAAYAAPGNLSMVMNVMSHADVRTLQCGTIIAFWILCAKPIDQRNLRPKNHLTTS
jgi:integrase